MSSHVSYYRQEHCLSRSFNIFYYPFIVLLMAIVGRSFLLEYTDLIDPTESRYAVVAQIMKNSGNWLTPMLPMPEGIVPYLGKPPFHFWMTALSYSIFGVDEWSARLPSLIGSVLILITLFWFARVHFSRATGWISCLIYISSGMPFLLAGASVVDLTLTALITTSVSSLYFGVSSQQTNNKAALLASIFAALSFLTKGPIALVLIWMPILFWSIARKDFTWSKSFPWARSIAIFILLVSPWFILNEIQNPGFIKYFFWNENIARYLLKDYGDRYGSGHRQPYGTSWLMLSAGFSPWTFALIPLLINRIKAKTLRFSSMGSPEVFVVCWMLSAPLFFSLVMQLHGMYILPALPPLSIYLAQSIISEDKAKHVLQRISCSGKFIPLVLLISATFILVGQMFSFELIALLSGLGTLIITVCVLVSVKGTVCPVHNISRLSTSFVGVYIIAMCVISPYLSETRSAELALKKIALNHSCEGREHIHQIGVMTSNTYSLYWTANAWENELSNKVNIKYVGPGNIQSSNVCFYVSKAKDDSSALAGVNSNATLVDVAGKWRIYAVNRLNFPERPLLERSPS